MTTETNTSTATKKTVLSKSGKTHEEVLAELRKFCEMNNSPKTLAAIEKLMTDGLDLYNKIAAVYYCEGTTADDRVCKRIDGKEITKDDLNFFYGEETSLVDEYSDKYLGFNQSKFKAALEGVKIKKSLFKPSAYEISEEFGVFTENGAIGANAKQYTGRIPLDQFRFSIDGIEYGILTEYIGEEVNSLVDTYLSFQTDCSTAIDFELMDREDKEDE